MKRFRELLKGDEGISLTELVVAIGLSGLIALGCTQVALASINSAKYIETKAMSTVNTSTLNRIVTNDMDNAVSFSIYGAGLSDGVSCTSKFTAPSGEDVKPLMSMQYLDGSSIGYEVRTVGGSGSLWRVTCPVANIPNGSPMMLRNGLPANNSQNWINAVQCFTYPAGGALSVSTCALDQILDNHTANPGVIVNLPATVENSHNTYPAQTILAARSGK